MPIAPSPLVFSLAQIKPFKFVRSFQIAFEQKLHENVLEQILVQYDPDASQYIQLTQRVYDHVNENRIFDLLR